MDKYTVDFSKVKYYIEKSMKKNGTPYLKL